MLRRPPHLKYFVPRLEVLETRSLLSSVPAAAAQATEAVGSSNGQLAVMAVCLDAHTKRITPNGDAVIQIYNYDQPTAGAAVGNFSNSQTITTDVPASRNVRLAFGDLTNGLSDLVVAGPDGNGAIVGQIFTGSVDASGHWQFTSDAVFRQDFGQVKADRHTELLALTDVNGDHMPDVVITSDTQVAVLLGSVVQSSTGTVSYDYTALPVVPSPFLPFENKHDTSDGAAKGQASDVIVRGWDPQNKQELATEADGQVLFAPMTVTGPGQGTTGSVTFGSTDSVAILPSGVSFAAPAKPTMGGGASLQQVKPLKGMAPELFVITDVHADGSPDLLVEIGDKMYVGIGSETNSTGTAGLNFTWSVQAIPPQLIGSPLFLTSVDGDPTDDRELFAIVLQPQSGTPTPSGVDIFLYIDEDERGDEDGEEKNDRGDVSATP